MDLYLTEDGDLAANHAGDISTTSNPWRDDLQQAYVLVMTEQGDFLTYPGLGASLNDLKGMPQSPATGKHGEDLIRASLQREGRFVGLPFTVTAVPTGPNTIRFDVEIVSGSRQQVRFSIEQELGI